MKKTLTRGVAGAAALVVFFGSNMFFGSNPASAINEYVGLTYEQVMNRTRGRAVIATRVGQYLPTEQCIVTGSRRATFLDSSGNNKGKVLVDLNCHDPMTTAGHSGYSVATPQGKKAQDLKASGLRLTENYAKAVDAGKAPYCESRYANCQKICKMAGTCSDELLEYLGL